MPLSSTVGGVSSVNTARGSTRIFSVTELQRVGDSLQPTGVAFQWSNENFAAPRGPWVYAIQLRTVRRDLPGGEEPAEQVLGWNYAPFTCSGLWDDRHAGAGYASQTRLDFENMVKRGNPIKVQMEKIAVTGLITHFQITYQRSDRIGYQFTFSPHFRFEGETVRTEVNPSRKVTTDPATAVKKTRAALDALQAAQSAARASNLSRVQQLLKTGLFSDINASLDDLEQSIAQAEKTVSDEILVAQDAANALNRGAQIMASAKTAVASLLSKTRSALSTTHMALDTYADTLSYESWLRLVNFQGRLLAAQADNAQRDFALRARAKPQRLHRVRQGETLYSISNIYYGTPHHWQQILSYNHLSALILNGGELLTIPELR